MESMVPVLFVDNEIEAELAKGRLESEGIAAQVRFSARGGYPRYAAGTGVTGVTAPLTTYEVLVTQADAPDARRILGEVEQRPIRTGIWRRSVMRVFAIAVLVSLVLPLLWGAMQQLRLLF